MSSKIIHLSLKACFFIVLLCGFSGCAEKESPLPDHLGGQLFQGKRRLDVKCHGCHGWLGEGGSQAPPLVYSGRMIIPPKEFISRVLHGGGGMPAYQSALGEKEILQMMDWLRKIPEQKAP